MQPLPIDSLLPEVVASLGDTPRLVIEAPPGAGKTTRIPSTLLDANLAGVDASLCARITIGSATFGLYGAPASRYLRIVPSAAGAAC